MVVYINGNDMYLKNYNDVTIFYSFCSTVKKKDALKKKNWDVYSKTEIDTFIELANFDEPKPSSALNSYQLLLF